MTAQRLVVTRTAAWMADWSSYTDDIDHQDPEVAIVDGYRDVVLPAGALTALAVDTDLASRVAGAAVQRRWEGVRPVVAGEQLTATRTERAGAPEVVFTDPGGAEVARERFEALDTDAAAGDVGGGGAFRTGPIDRTRLRALSWGLASVAAGGPEWSWGEEPEQVLAALSRLVLPGLVAVRGALWGSASAAVRSVTCQPTGIVLDGERLLVRVTGHGHRLGAVVAAGDRVVAHVEIEADRGADLTAMRWPGARPAPL